MKTANNPLVRAMHKQRRDEVPFKFETLPRVFELRQSEIAGNPGKKPGDSITVVLKGTIKSVHDDGRSMMDVHAVEHQGGEELREDKDIPMVRTETSMSPGAA